MSACPFGAGVYHLSISGADCRAELFLNEMPIIEADLCRCDALAPVINPFLTAGSNTLVIRISFVKFSAGALSPRARISIAVFEYSKHETPPYYRAPDSLGSFELAPDAIHTSYERMSPQSFEFRSNAIDVASTYLNAVPILSTKPLEEFEIYMRELLAARDLDAILDLFGPKIHDYAKAFAVDKEQVRQSLAGVLQNGYFRCGLVDNSLAPLRLHSYGAGRIWEVKRGSAPYMMSRADVEGGVYQMRIYVSAVAGKLRIVR